MKGDGDLRIAHRERWRGNVTRRGWRAGPWGVLLVVVVGVMGFDGGGEVAGKRLLLAQVAPVPQPAPPPVGGTTPGTPGQPVPPQPGAVPPAVPAGVPAGAAAPVPGAPAPGVGSEVPGPPSYHYDPSARRDPFEAITLDGQRARLDDPSLPPLQRVGLTELQLIGIIWGGFGYTAMVQTPDGKGYAVRKGTKVGPNNGIVTSITESAITVEEQFVDVYGQKQVREYLKRLREKESTE